MARAMRAKMAKTVNMADGLDDDEKDRFLSSNLVILPFFTVDLEELSQKYGYLELVVGLSQPVEVSGMEDEKKNKKLRL